MKEQPNETDCLNQTRYSRRALLATGILAAVGGSALGYLIAQTNITRNQVDDIAAANVAKAPPKPTGSARSVKLSEEDILDLPIDFDVKWLLRDAHAAGFISNPNLVDLVKKYKQGKVSAGDIEKLLEQQCNAASYRIRLSKCLNLTPITDIDQLKKVGTKIGWVGQYQENFKYLESFPPKVASSRRKINICLANFDKAIHFNCAKQLIANKGMRLADLNEGITYLGKAGDLPSATFVNACSTGEGGLLNPLYFGREGSPWTLVNASDGLVTDHCGFLVVRPK